MKPLQIGLLVLVGALGGAVIMKVTQHPQPAPLTAAAPRPVPVQPSPAADAPAPVPAAEPAPPSQPPEKAAAVPETKPLPAVPRPKPVRTARVSRPPVVLAQAIPPVSSAAQPEPAMPAAPPPVTEAPAPAPPPETTPDAEPAAAPAEVAPQPAVAPSVTLKAGTMLTVRLGENLSSQHNQTGDTFTATLDKPLEADGFIIAERGARLEGRVVETDKGGHMKGEAALSVELTTLNTSDGQRVRVQTETFRKQNANATGDHAAVMAAAAGVGAIIGALAGGGKGAAIGAGAGGAAGAGGVAVSGVKPAVLSAETKVSFRLSQSVTITERVSQ